jgi:5'-3' exonuclease
VGSNVAKTTLIIDGNNFFIRALFSRVITEEDKSTPKWDLWRYLTFDHLLRFVCKFNAKEVIIAVDGPEPWRRKVYKQYKANRAKMRDDSSLDWDEFFNIYNEYLEDLKEHLPYKIIKLKYCEADDTIAVLAKRLDNVIILSNDSDYTQLTEDHIRIYSPHKKEFIEKQPDFVVIHSLDGLKKDNIQNILTPLDWDGTIKPPKFGPKKAEKLIAGGPLQLNGWLVENKLEERFIALKKLIDFNYIPEYLVNMINETYDNYSMPDNEKIGEFILKYSWKNYVNKISEVEQRLLELY